MSDDKSGLPTGALGDDIPESVMNELLVAFADGAGSKHAAPPSKPGAAAKPESAPATPVAPVAVEPTPDAPPREDPVVVIEADDLPDAVVLDGDPSSGGPAVFDGDASSKRLGVDPRFRARRIAVRRAEGRKRLRWFVVAAAVLLVAVGVLAVLASPLFAIDTVDVEGNVYADPAAIQAVVDSLEGKPILTADLDSATARIEAIPWVAAAHVTMHFPHRVSIQIAERTPVASFAGTDGQYRVIDGDAYVVAVLPNAPLDYPPITGILPNTAAGADAGTAVHGAAQLISALPPTLRDRLSSVTLGPSGELTLVLDGDEGHPQIQVDFGAANDFRDKLVAVLNEMTRRPPGSYTSIDASDPDTITVQ
jgi:cell division protein FtsQ